MKPIQTESTPQIDFLPKRHRRDREAMRRSTSCRSVLAFFVIGIAATTVVLIQTPQRLAAEQERLDPMLEKSRFLQAERSRIDTVLQELQSRAAVVDELTDSPSRTFLFWAIAGAAPEQLSLSKLSIASKQSTTRRPDPSATETAVAQDPFAKDVARLRAGKSSGSTTITIEGTATDDAAVAEFLANLEELQIFSQVALLFTDRQALRDQTGRRFGARLVVRRRLEPSEVDRISESPDVASPPDSEVLQ
ncbi:PilN domain-containing protein [Stratiformator vulcanicus]|uniref:Fimbrial assembly protein (PilN) n=1 Tax=Stratiformator vulcanicus TaxID=2527980 RepID=A0A517R511_9PLAN|nr:PilN domain-containing protein [Stratiformator vulcanicus]QDT38976.1 Fimbrial assembly protein (PilN) [Stratiformator vulcanicus]